MVLWKLLRSAFQHTQKWHNSLQGFGSASCHHQWDTAAANEGHAVCTSTSYCYRHEMSKQYVGKWSYINMFSCCKLYTHTYCWIASECNTHVRVQLTLGNGIPRVSFTSCQSAKTKQINTYYICSEHMVATQLLPTKLTISLAIAYFLKVEPKVLHLQPDWLSQLCSVACMHRDTVQMLKGT